MTTRPRREDRQPQQGALFLSQIVARNVRAYRAARGHSQVELAAQLERLGVGWTEQTVRHAERGRRSISVDELAALAVALEVPVPRLLDSSGPVLATGPPLDVGGGVIPPPYARWLTTSAELDDDKARAIVRLAGTGMDSVNPDDSSAGETNREDQP